MTTITKDSAVFFNYTLTDADKNLIDQSPEGQPLGYLHGHHNIIPGLEKQLEGKSAGEKLTAVVEPTEAYGEHEEQGVQAIPKDNFQDVESIEVGMKFQSQTSDGNVIEVVVTEVTDELITVDANHPLAGKTLTFDVEIVEVRAGTEDEISHGHVHGNG